MHNIKELPKRTLILIIILLLNLSFLSAVNYQMYKVRKGDTLYGLSKRYGVTVDNLKKLNKLTSDKLSLGQQLKIKPEQPKAKLTIVEKKKPASTKPSPEQGITETSKSKTKTEAQITAPANPPKQEMQITLPSQGMETTQAIPTNLPEDYYHTVMPKENLYRVALNANITLPELLKFNQFPDANVVIKPGMKLIIKDWTGQPQVSGTTTDMEITAPPEASNTPLNVAEGDSVVIEKVYIVQRKDTLFKIAKENNMTVEQLKTLNKLTDNSIKTGQKLYIVAPRGGVEEEEQKVIPVVITEEELKAKAKIRSDLIMPVDAKVLSEYGIRNGRPHKGIDLGAPAGTPVYAVLDGTVVYSGHQGNYGNVVVIEHPDFIMTVYGHNEKNLVNVGDVVKQGQIIATTGSTGNATTPHVHFEYRIKGKAINPRKVLPLG